MSKVKLFVTIGIAGCGKSTWATNNKGHYQMFDEILSSDEYRIKYFGDVNDQTHNAEVFKYLHTDMVTLLKSGKSVCVDATNITRKSRAAIINLVEMNKIDCEKIAVLFAVAPNIIKEQNANRERKLPAEVLDRMMRKFEMPFKGEGFDGINIVWRNNLDLEPYQIELNKMKGFDQKNPNHTLDLYEHCLAVKNSLFEYASNNPELVFAGLLHDVGKLYTQTWDDEKQLCHYIGHENYGAYKALFYDYDDLIDRYKVAFYINYHMEMFRLKDAKPSTIEKYKSQFGQAWDDILLLHEADLNAQ